MLAEVSTEQFDFGQRIDVTCAIRFPVGSHGIVATSRMSSIKIHSKESQIDLPPKPGYGLLLIEMRKFAQFADSFPNFRL